MIRRRDVLRSAFLLAAAGSARQVLAAAPAESKAASQFSYAVLKGRARALASAAYSPVTKLPPDSLQQLDYDQYQAIRFREDHSLWFADNLGFRIQFFHMGRGFKEPVRMYEVANGAERELTYRPESFDFGKSGVDGRKLPADLGYAGFRIQAATNWTTDVAAFLGASYFRAVGGDTRQYGLSARGLAIDTAINGPEEFPRFTAFWFERPPANARTMIIYALLDTPSAAGAYRFVITPGATQTMDVDAALYPRKQIGRLGIAPLTSMFQCGENDRRLANDWRPEIHDSDGLSMLSGSGEWIWRPIVNPAGVRVSSYVDENPRGFGLLQRDRNFENYQDDGVFYERRPSLWVEPRGAWGKGAVQLVELPAPDETYDNIVAYWNPAQAVQAGSELLFGYRLYWGTQMPTSPPLAHVVATRTGIGGVLGQPRRYYSERFAIDFAGGELASLLGQSKVEPVISASRGQIEVTSARPLYSVNGFRAMFDIKPPDDAVDPIDLRLFLRRNGQPLTETWMYQWTPPSPRERRDALALSGAEVG
ncbi:MAG TPA: glucan biosynthesis protein D [Steroidobacteraceae bacterium]|jgi:glucans biosynthesis protein